MAIRGAGISPWNELRLGGIANAAAINNRWGAQRSASVDAKRKLAWDREKLLAEMGLQRETRDANFAQAEKMADKAHAAQADETKARSADLLAKLGLEEKQNTADNASRELIARMTNEQRANDSKVRMDIANLNVEQRAEAERLKNEVAVRRADIEQQLADGKINRMIAQSEVDQLNAETRERMASIAQQNADTSAQSVESQIDQRNIQNQQRDRELTHKEDVDAFDAQRRAISTEAYNAMQRNAALTARQTALGDPKTSDLGPQLTIPEVAPKLEYKPRNPVQTAPAMKALQDSLGVSGPESEKRRKIREEIRKQYPNATEEEITNHLNDMGIQ